MKPQDWDRAEKLFHTLVGLDPAARSGVLADISREDPAMFSELEALLAAHDSTGALDDLRERFAPEALGSSTLAPLEKRLTGQRISHWEVGELIGWGGMGEVYRATDVRLDRDVAVKVLPAWLGRDAVARERFLVEARVVSSINHPNVCGLHDIGETADGQLFLVMPYYEGQTLKSRLRESRLSAPEAVRIALGTARGLQAAHERGVVHRDIKPANLLLSDSGEVKILDFGVAKATDVSLTRPGQNPGTTHYMSPEQRMGERVDARSDLWSLGLVLQEMLTGSRPGSGGAAGLDREQLAGQPASLLEVVRRLLARSPEERYQDAVALTTDLERLAGTGALLDAEPPPRQSRILAELRRRKVLHAAGGALLLAGAWLAVDATGLAPGADSGGGQSGTMASERRSIAVLPFASAEPENVSLAEGIADDLRHALGDLRVIRVAAATSTIALGSDKGHVAEIGEALNVTHILDGSVRASGDSVRVTTWLVEVGTDSQLWSGTYTRPLENIFAVQDEIATNVVRELQVTLLDSIPGARRTHPEAYRLRLQAQHLLRTTGRVEAQAESLLVRAREFDANYVPAILLLARVYNRKAFVEPDPYRNLTRALVNRALELEPDNGLAHGWRGWIALFYDRDPETSARANEKALLLDPTNVDLLHGAQQVARILGRARQAVALGQYEVIVDPICARCYGQLGRSYMVAGNLDAAENALRTSATLDPHADDLVFQMDLGIIAIQRGDPHAALTVFRSLPAGAPARSLGIALASHDLGLDADFAEAVAALAAGPEPPRWLAPAYAWSGDADKAFAAITEYRELGMRGYRFLPEPQDPIYRRLHGDPRWKALLRERWFTPEQIAAIDFDPEFPKPVIDALEEAGFSTSGLRRAAD